MTTTSQPAGTTTEVSAELPLARGAVDRAGALALRHTLATDWATAVIDHVMDHAKREPDRPAVADGERTLTYRALLGQVAAVRKALLDAGVRAGQAVAAVGHRSSDTPVVFLALESLGASYLPIDPSWPQIRVRDVLERSRAALLLDYCPAEEPAHAARSAATAARVGVLALAEHRTDEGPDHRAHGELPDTGPAELQDTRGADRSREVRYTIFTSGTTGRPKGATIEHSGMLNHLWAKITDLSLGPDDAVAFTAPLVFDIAIWQMLCPLLVGGRLVVLRDATMRLPHWLNDALETTGVTVVELVPTVVGWLVGDVKRRNTGGLRTLRWLLSTGEELYPAVAERVLTTLPHVSVVNAYGPTECSDDVTHHVVTHADLGRPRLPIGSPVANTALYLLTQGPDGRWRAAEPEESGELFVGGAGVGRGYLNDPDTTGQAFFLDPFDPSSPTGRLYRTGDLARFEEGLVYYLGRADRQVKVAGVRMELDEIEAVLSRHPAVQQCAVIVAGEGERTELSAHYSLHTPVDEKELRQALSEALPAAMVPRRWRKWDALPLTHNGKVNHHSLRMDPPRTKKEA
ncbi:amino acid adenylation domain-containing protein [Streptomyces sp. NBC_01471]|uniref:amino acid adenylation domain-containing protein n=1 Tax=Streptomyces sp. NBC_01471 TaxID=2903879 RepID=UPI003253A356